MTPILVTGGAGFIGSAVVRLLIARGHAVVSLDALTYAAHPATVAELRQLAGHTLERVDLLDRAGLDRVLRAHRPQAVIHLAAETHVDRSIDGPGAFVRTNVQGTATLLEALRGWLNGGDAPDGFRLLHASTDEVFGSLGPEGVFTTDSPYDPRSPYAASKAGADHLVRAWRHTYGLPAIISYGSNTYGPRQFPEKLVPHMIRRALRGQPLPLYGDGLHRRAWQHVNDHARALLAVLDAGKTGASYTLGGGEERSNLELLRGLCAALDELSPGHRPHHETIEHVADRPGHDRRYALCDRALRDLGWAPQVQLIGGLRDTVAWYLAHPDRLEAPGYSGDRLGVAS